MTRQVLIAIADERIALQVRRLLERRGLAVTTAADGASLLATAVRSPPDLVILSFRLGRIAGLDAAQKFRASAKTAHLPLLLLGTAREIEAAKEQLARLRIAGSLALPFSARDLMTEVNRLLGPASARTRTMGELLLAAWRGRWTALCRLQGSNGNHQLTFIHGHPVRLVPGFQDPDLGHRLLRLDQLSEKEFTFFRQEAQGNPEALVQMGCLSRPDLLAAEIEFLSSELVDAFAHPPFQVQVEVISLPPGLHPAPISTLEVLYQGFRRHLAEGLRHRLAKRLGGRYIGRNRSFFQRIPQLSLAPADRALIPLLDGSRRLSAVVGKHPEAWPLVYLLVRLDLVGLTEHPAQAPTEADFPQRPLLDEELVPAPEEQADLERFSDLLQESEEDRIVPPKKSAPISAEISELSREVRSFHADLDGKDYYRIFGLTPQDFSFEALKKSYFELTRRFGPETLMELGGDDGALVEAILDRIATAYNTLSDVVRKESYDTMLGSDQIGLGRDGDDTFRAQVQFQSGQAFIQMEEWGNAEKALQDASTIDPDSGVYLAHLAWAIYRNPRHASSAAMREQAKQMLNRALRLERTPEGHAFKGWMLLEAEQENPAESEMDKALKLDPRNLLALKGKEELARRREARKKGLLKRFFT